MPTYTTRKATAEAKRETLNRKIARQYKYTAPAVVGV